MAAPAQRNDEIQREANKLFTDATGKVSAWIRYFNVGMLSVNWAVLAGDEKLHLVPPNARHLKWQILAISLLNLTEFVAEYLQSSSKARLNRKLVDDVERGRTQRIQYNPSDRNYKMAFHAYKAKQIIVAVAAIWFVTLYGFLLVMRNQ